MMSFTFSSRYKTGSERKTLLPIAMRGDAIEITLPLFPTVLSCLHPLKVLLSFTRPSFDKLLISLRVNHHNSKYSYWLRAIQNLIMIS